MQFYISLQNKNGLSTKIVQHAINTKPTKKYL